MCGALRDGRCRWEAIGNGHDDRIVLQFRYRDRDIRAVFDATHHLLITALPRTWKPAPGTIRKLSRAARHWGHDTA